MQMIQTYSKLKPGKTAKVRPESQNLEASLIKTLAFLNKEKTGKTAFFPRFFVCSFVVSDVFFWGSHPTGDPARFWPGFDTQPFPARCSPKEHWDEFRARVFG